ncbi:DNA/RNA-binding domain of Phe-tRNA-synthetase-like protein [Kitasatospora sp. MAP12-15]|uniref:B3/B4 domain-containing protein n=1 Tax=unclassified Kitasatospora TaxID=2633591 RepID=UPI0024755A4C|nr:phenylalanine--tRNA ligase beta subunit-related protein [Kitasatospora sp. MAP12-44]MDH6109376.1 DNA/RNA-binding domain of Phe-tRNA-synthetase-like protein [Kitasatospora sp. MAP12-44]
MISTLENVQDWLAAASVAPEVSALRPDYRALLVVAEGLRPGPSDQTSERLLARAEQAAREQLAQQPLADHPQLTAWREAFKAAGMKPSRTRPSVDALLRRLESGLPRVDRLTDVYNAVSIAHVLPLGGEDLDHYQGPARLLRATGTESFDTTADGGPVVESPEPGEVVWADDLGVTCRRWNWRQCTRTRITDSTTRALFILDGLGPMDDEALLRAGADLVSWLTELDPGVRTTSRLVV